MADPKITVYVVSHNKGEFLEEAIESVLKQTMDDWELIIIDDNSTDNTQGIINLYQGDHRIRSFKTEGIGLPAVCNLAIKEAKGGYIIRLDGDDVFEENILLVLDNYLNLHPDVVMVFPDYYLIDVNGEIISLESRKKFFYTNHMLDMPPNGACAMVRKSLYEKLNGYREDLGVQDGFDLWSRINKSGFLCNNVNLPLFYYRRHEQNITNDVERILSARRAIKRDMLEEHLQDSRPFICVIPCRRNYDFVPDLWNQEANSRNLLEIKIEACLSLDMLDHVVVASDNPEVGESIRKYDDPRLSYFARKTKNTVRSVKISETLRNICLKYDPEFKGITVMNYIQTPFVTIDTIEESIHTLILNHADCSFGVDEINFPIYQRTAYGLMPINPPRAFSTDFDKVYCETRTSLATRNINLKTGSIIGPKAVYYRLTKDECFFIETSRDLKIAKLIDELM